jgi:hypothetical protein
MPSAIAIEQKLPVDVSGSQKFCFSKNIARSSDTLHCGFYEHKLARFNCSNTVWPQSKTSFFTFQVIAPYSTCKSFRYDHDILNRR